MKKCTMCIDRIYNDAFAVEDRVPACVATCPVGARHFGDLGDPDSDVSKLVAARGGYAPMPELDYKPVNRYLPPRARPAKAKDAALVPAESDAPGILGWIDRMLSR
jgi:Fe-S-cluster-containing dehydrogenase component